MLPSRISMYCSWVCVSATYKFVWVYSREYLPKRVPLPRWYWYARVAWGVITEREPLLAPGACVRFDHIVFPSSSKFQELDLGLQRMQTFARSRTRALQKRETRPIVRSSGIQQLHAHVSSFKLTRFFCCLIDPGQASTFFLCLVVYS